MKILAPCSKKEEVLPLIEAGADELYCGIVPTEWCKDYGIFDTLNRREGYSANFSRVEDLQDAVKIAHERGVPVFATMNGVYSEDQYPLIKKIILGLADIGVDGWIIADIGLLLTLQKMKLSQEIHVGTGGTIFNYRTANFYKKLGASRVVLDRQLTIDEISGIAERVRSRVELEVFILNTPCPNVDGFCTFYHGLRVNRGEIAAPLHAGSLKVKFYESFDSNYVGRGCELNYSKRVFNEAGERVEGEVCSAGGMGKGCGACALLDFKKMGIKVLKIVERGAPTESKLKDTRFIRSVLDLLGKKKNFSKKEFVIQSQKLYCETYRCTECSGFSCYYPSLFNAIGE